MALNRKMPMSHIHTHIYVYMNDDNNIYPKIKINDSCAIPQE